MFIFSVSYVAFIFHDCTLLCSHTLFYVTNLHCGLMSTRHPRWRTAYILKKDHLSLTDPRDALHHGKRAANKSGGHTICKGPFTPSASTSVYTSVARRASTDVDARLRRYGTHGKRPARHTPSASTSVDGRRRARCEWAFKLATELS